jgi:hypothetical protein
MARRNKNKAASGQTGISTRNRPCPSEGRASEGAGMREAEARRSPQVPAPTAEEMAAIAEVDATAALSQRSSKGSTISLVPRRPLSRPSREDIQLIDWLAERAADVRAMEADDEEGETTRRHGVELLLASGLGGAEIVEKYSAVMRTKLRLYCTMIKLLPPLLNGPRMADDAAIIVAMKNARLCKVEIEAGEDAAAGTPIMGPENAMSPALGALHPHPDGKTDPRGFLVMVNNAFTKKQRGPVETLDRGQPAATANPRADARGAQRKVGLPPPEGDDGSSTTSTGEAPNRKNGSRRGATPSDPGSEPTASPSYPDPTPGSSSSSSEGEKGNRRYPKIDGFAELPSRSSRTSGESTDATKVKALISHFSKKHNKYAGPDDAQLDFSSYHDTLTELVHALGVGNADALRVLPITLRDAAKEAYVRMVRPALDGSNRQTLGRALNLLYKALYNRERLALELVLWERCSFIQFASGDGEMRGQFTRLVEYLRCKQKLLGPAYCDDAHLRNRILGAVRGQAFLANVETSRKITTGSLVAAITSAVDEMTISAMEKSKESTYYMKDQPRRPSPFPTTRAQVPTPRMQFPTAADRHPGPPTPLGNRSIGRNVGRQTTPARLLCFVCGSPDHLYRGCNDPRKQQRLGEYLATAQQRGPSHFQRALATYHSQMDEPLPPAADGVDVADEDGDSQSSASEAGQEGGDIVMFTEDEEEDESFLTSTAAVATQLANRSDEHRMLGLIRSKEPSHTRTPSHTLPDFRERRPRPKPPHLAQQEAEQNATHPLLWL